jgi:hypothetical protein
LPTTFVTRPVPRLISRIRLSPVSATNRLPLPSIVRPEGLLKAACVAGQPSPYGVSVAAEQMVVAVYGEADAIRPA